jgi:hypothetical protein
MQELRSRWPAVAVAASFLLIETIFYFGGPEIKSYSALIGVVPIAAAAWLLGARVAVAVLLIEGIANYSLVAKPGGTSRDITVDVIEGAALAAVAISVGVTHRAKRRLAEALATDPVTFSATGKASCRRSSAHSAWGRMSPSGCSTCWMWAT